MFDVGFSEMLLVGLVALLVFGPERLPRVAKEAALWIRKARSMANSVKQEIDRELQLQDLKETMDKQKREMEKLLLADHSAVKSVLDVQIKPDSKSEERTHE
ncbi:MAG: Sec-independent protein translocase protein TatB [Proteobacteria bacterium]|nr:Sec-independent protein translocase protein TatB [Pseudomonadota bacterium]